MPCLLGLITYLSVNTERMIAYSIIALNRELAFANMNPLANPGKSMAFNRDFSYSMKASLTL